MIKKIAIFSLSACLSFQALAGINSNPPSVGAYESGNYRSLFSEVGKSNTQIDNHVNAMYEKMFYGASNEKLYYTLDANEAYIKTIDTNDVRSEGMSWGMTIAVMMNKKSEFDKLWRFAHDRMKLTTGLFPGTFAWQVKVNGTSVDILDEGAAPDGELYMAFALFNAAGRWGNGTGIFNYEAQANQLLATIKNHLMDPYEKQILFSPYVNDTTDPSYHIPAFYDFFADVAASNNNYWRDAADASRTFLSNHFRQTQHGLASYLANFDGTPKTDMGGLILGNPGHIYEGDAWRVAMNVGLDAHLSGAKQWHKDANNALLYFFNSSASMPASHCPQGYMQKYHMDGSVYGTCNEDNWMHGEGQISTNAIAGLAATRATIATNFVNKLWNTAWPTGTYRYYHGSLKMLSVLHASGKFRIYSPANTANQNVASNKTTIKTFKDAFVRGGTFANTNYGTATSLAVKNSEGNLTYERRAVMSFDRSRIGNNGDRNIVKATLRLKMQTVNEDAQFTLAGIFGISNRWTETGNNEITYNNMTETGTEAATFFPTAANTWTEVDVTDYLKNDPSTSRTVFMIRNITGGSKSNWSTHSRETSFAPELVIEWN